MTSERSGYAPVKGGELYYEVAGEGPAVALIHAGVSTSAMWDDFWPEATRRFRCLRYDTRGFGKSRTSAVEFSNRQDLADLLAHVGMASAAIIGVSRGGQIAVDFALEFPAMVNALVLAGSGVSGQLKGYRPSDDEMALFEEMEKAEQARDWDAVVEIDNRVWLAGPRRRKADIDPALWARVAAINRVNYGRSDPDPIPVVLDPPALGRLGEIDRPALVIVGEYDTSGALKISEILAGGIAGARRVVMPGAAHLPPMERPQEFNRLALDFLGSLPAARA